MISNTPLFLFRKVVMKPKVYKLTLGDKTLDIWLNWYGLYKLSLINHEIYLDVNRTIMSGSNELMDYLKVIYAGYVTAAPDDSDIMDFNRFLIELDYNDELVDLAFQILHPPKKAKTSPTLS